MDKRSIWADEEVIIIKPLEVYSPVKKLNLKFSSCGGVCMWRGRGKEDALGEEKLWS